MISAQESEYIIQRKTQTSEAFQAFIYNLQPFQNVSFDKNDAPTIGIAMSGGGYRSMLTGAGILSALDSRSSNTRLGGILQSTTYLAGISGGLWLVMNNFVGENRPYVERISDIAKDLQIPLLEGIPNIDIDGLRQSIDDGKRAPQSSEVPEISISSTPGIKQKTSLLPMIVRSLFSTNKGNTTGSTPKKIMDFYKALTVEAHTKRSNGFKISVIDYWGRALARRVFPKKYRTTGVTISSLTKLPSFQNGSQPFPIINAIEVNPNAPKDSICSHTMEINPFEFGSWDSFLNAFMNIKYLGTTMKMGLSQHKNLNLTVPVCVSGYDNAGFLTATSSGLFNALFKYIYKIIFDVRNELTSFFDQFLRMFGFSSRPTSPITSYSEYAIYSPNPFYQLGHGLRGRSIDKAETLYLADGGDDGQNIPLSSLMVPGRSIDLILAYDMASEVNNFPNASSLRKTASRYHANSSELTIPIFMDPNGCWRRIFPRVFSADAFMSSKLKKQPTFLGCDWNDYPLHNAVDNEQFTVLENFTPPIIVYTPNFNYSFPSNTSTFRTTFTEEEVQGMYENGIKMATFEEDPLFSLCITCAALKRKSSVLMKSCSQCYSKFCFHGDGRF